MIETFAAFSKLPVFCNSLLFFAAAFLYNTFTFFAHSDITFTKETPAQSFKKKTFFVDTLIKHN
jgi:hypothetical protein